MIGAIIGDIVGGDRDTLAAITCSIAESYYGVPEEIKDRALTFAGCSSILYMI